MNREASIPEPDDRRNNYTDTAAKSGYRTPAERDHGLADQAAEWLTDWSEGPIGDTTRSERQAAAHHFTPGSHRAYVAVLDALDDRAYDAGKVRIQRRRMERPRSGPEVACLDSSYRSKQERTTETPCPRAFGKAIENDHGETVFAFLRCRARTCPVCRLRLDETDAERIADGIGPDAWLIEIPRDQWRTVSKRLDRADATALQCASNRDPHSVVVVADMKPTADAHKLTDPASMIRDLMATRPTGQERRLTTKGRIVSRDEWDDRQHAEAIEGDWIAPGVTPADIELVAAALGVETRTAADTVTLRCKWDDWRSVAIRRWARNPSRLEWADLKRATLRAEGIPVDDPPLAAYAEAS